MTTSVQRMQNRSVGGSVTGKSLGAQDWVLNHPCAHFTRLSYLTLPPPAPFPDCGDSSPEKECGGENCP